MTKLKRLVCGMAACLLSLSLCGAAVAQKGTAKSEAKGKGRGIVGRIEAVLPSLKLTAAQKSDVDKLLQKTGDEQKKLRSSGDPKANRPKLKQLNQDLQRELEKVLTAEQSKQLKEALARKRNKNKPGAPPAAK